ncbi:MAG: hypothetical protein ABIZ07_12280 [Dermatophilaceae bacterium]
MTLLRGLRPLLARFDPWRRRAGGLLLAWLGLIGTAAVLGLSPSVPHLAAILLALALLMWFVIDHAAAQHVTTWPLTDFGGLGATRGGDFRVTNLAGRLEAANAGGEGRADLAVDLHAQLTSIIDQRLNALHGITLETEPAWAKGVMPPELWDFVSGPPDPDLPSPAILDHILRRIEQW